MTSAFIIEVNSQLQPDPNEETAALLRVLIHKVDNTTFGGDAPSIPQWSGPPHMIVQVQAILFASLATSLFSAFLAMLGKQWINRYASVDMRGSAIERSQNRQRKLDGVVSWYFDHVMESLPLMLQVALLLLGLALSRYLWEINTTVALVVLGFTSAGVFFFLFIVVAGAAFVSCPYQTPGAQILRQAPGVPHRIIQGILRHIPNIPRYISDTIHCISHAPHMLHSVFSAAVQGSNSCFILRDLWIHIKRAPHPLVEVPGAAFVFTFFLPFLFVSDAYKVIIWLLVACSRRLLQWWLEQQTTLSDTRCILWTLRTSLDGPVRLSTLNYLVTTTLADSDPTPIVHCFNIFFGCVKANHFHGIIVAQGMEQLAAVSSVCCLQTLSHLMAIDPMSRVLEDTRRRYRRTFPYIPRFKGLPFAHTFYAIHRAFYPDLSSFWRAQPRIRWSWGGYNPSNNEHVTVAHALTRIARFEYQNGGRERVSRWILRFALHSLSQSPPPPTSIVIDSLSIVATDLGCNPSKITPLDKRCVRI